MMLGKVQLYSEGHKNFAHLPLFIQHYLEASNFKWKVGQIFCGFLRLSELYTHGKAMQKITEEMIQLLGYKLYLGNFFPTFSAAHCIGQV